MFIPIDFRGDILKSFVFVLVINYSVREEITTITNPFHVVSHPETFLSSGYVVSIPKLRICC
jgi:hypothetical protein